MMSGAVAGTDAVKGWLMGFVGLFAALVGQDGMLAYDRFTFGIADLGGGFSLIPTLVGAFGFSEILTVLSQRVEQPTFNPVDSVLPRLRDVLVYWRTILRSGVIGVYVGILPGVGEDMAAWSSYAAAKRASKEADQFGKGSIEGLMAAETGDNASIPGGIIPALALAIPGSAPAAVLMAAMIIHGVQPGPMLMVNQPQFVYDVVAMTLLATLGILFYGLFMVKPLLTVIRIPRTIIMPVIFVLCTVGSFAIASRLFDIYVMVGTGISMFLLRRHNYPVPTMTFVLGLVLGDILDKSLRRGLTLSNGDFMPFLTRPICAVLAGITVFTMLMYIPAFNRAVKSGTARVKAIMFRRQSS
jgi:putative tricarboxylic transport membrane protein